MGQEMTRNMTFAQEMTLNQKEHEIAEKGRDENFPST